MTDKERSLEDLLAVRLVRIAEVVSRVAARRFQPRFSLRNTDLRIMNMLDRTDGVTVNEIARRAHVDSAWISRSIRHLEVEGMLVRRSHPSDSRLKVVALTPKGKDVLDQVRPLAFAGELKLMEGIDDPKFKDDLDRLLANAEAMLAEMEGEHASPSSSD
jgi:DNA-binding MarR family transcriptional regulator